MAAGPPLTVVVSLPLADIDGKIIPKTDAIALDGEALILGAEGLLASERPGRLVLLLADELQAFNIDRELHRRMSLLLNGLQQGEGDSELSLKSLKALFMDPLDGVGVHVRSLARQEGLAWIERNLRMLKAMEREFGISVEIKTWREFLEKAPLPPAALHDELASAMCQSVQLDAQWRTAVQHAQDKWSSRIARHPNPNSCKMLLGNICGLSFLQQLHLRKRCVCKPEKSNILQQLEIDLDIPEKERSDLCERCDCKLDKLNKLQELEGDLDIPEKDRLWPVLKRLLGSFDRLPVWTGSVFKQAYEFEHRKTKTEQTTPQPAPHLVSQLYVYYEAVLFVMAGQSVMEGQSGDPAHRNYWYPGFDFPVLAQMIGQISDVCHKHTSATPTNVTWQSFPKPKPTNTRTRALLGKEQAKRDMRQLKPVLQLFKCDKFGTASPLTFVSMDDAMHVMYEPLLGDVNVKDKHLTDADLLLGSGFANIFVVHDRLAIASETGRWEGLEPVYTCCGNILMFVLCRTEKVAKADDVGRITLTSFSQPLCDTLYPAHKALQILLHTEDRPAGFATAGFFDWASADSAMLEESHGPCEPGDEGDLSTDQVLDRRQNEKELSLHLSQTTPRRGARSRQREKTRQRQFHSEHRSPSPFR